MSDYRDLLERERRRFKMPGSFQDLERRRDRKRRNRRIASGLVALAIAIAGVGAGLYALRPTEEATPVVTPTPTVAPPVVSKTLPAPSGPIQFVDAQKGWAVGPNAEILATVDGGKTWASQYSGPVDILGVQFVDELHGWAVGEEGLVRTMDGGGSWEPISDQAFTSIQFVNPLTGWAVRSASYRSAPNQVVKTEDGGRTWIGQGLGADSVCALDEKVLWATGVGEGGITLAQSDDGGSSWTDTPIAVPPGEPWTATVRCAGIDAWVLVQGGGAAGHLPYALFHTTNGGPDATPVLQEGGTRPLGPVEGVRDARDPYPGPLFAFDGVDALFIGWCPACGNSVALYDAGAGSRTELVKEGATPLGMSFVDRQRGWILLETAGPGGGQQQVLATTDGGKTWSTLG